MTSLRFASLGSGSQGNATLVAAADTLLMIDCGFPRREVEARLARLDINPADIDAILVTHEHGDHAGGVAVLSRSYDIPVVLTHGTAATGRLDGAHQLRRINAGAAVTIGDITTRAVPVPHDAREPVQFLIEAGQRRLGVLTDLGSITPHVIDAYAGCDALLLECNHDLELLMSGPYPASLKRRVAGDYGHLNNNQAADFLMAVDTSRLETLVVGHLSEQNNRPEAALMALAPTQCQHNATITVACQAQGFDWITVNSSTERVELARAAVAV